jgi:hypothetical protein
MKAIIEIKDNFSIIFDVKEEISADDIISLIKENAIHLKKNGVPLFEVRLYKATRNYSPVFARGQLSLNYNDTGCSFITYFSGMTKPKWWTVSNVEFIKGIMFQKEWVEL